MNFKVVFKLATVLTKSQLRGYQRRRLIARIFGDPRIILATDAALVGGLAFLGYFMTSTILPNEIQKAIQEIVTDGLAGIPAAIAFAAILFGILSEISQPVESMSMDLVNWLPISPAEYVAGSTISFSYTYSFMLSLFLGISLGPAVAFGAVQVWGAAAIMSILSLFIGACVVELLRALTNRISSSFYKKSGRSGIFVRLFLTIIILVLFQLLFSGRVIVYLLKSVMQTVRAVWFVPVVWPSLTVLRMSQGSLDTSLLFGVLSFSFMAGLFALAAKFRALYWAPVPVSIRLTTQAYRPAMRRMFIPGLSAAESAILRKDLRSLTRRREMARFLAIPFVLAISMGVSLYPIGATPIPERSGFFALIPLYILPIAIFCGIVSMTSFGQEGAAVWNLYMAPVGARQLLRAKLVLAVLLGAAFGLFMLAVLGLLLRATVAYIPVLLPLGIAVVLEESVLGLYFGAKFPDFRETIRSRYVSVWGSLFGVLVALLVAMLTASPIFISILFRPSAVDQLAVLSLAIGLIVFFVASKLAERQIRVLLQNIRV